jgi:hypothetical protein
MAIELTKDLQAMIDAHPESPPEIVDPRTNRTYVLVSAEQYERVKALLEQDENLSDTYPAQMESAMRAGWADPAMDDYDRYDELRS